LKLQTEQVVAQKQFQRLHESKSENEGLKEKLNCLQAKLKEKADLQVDLGKRIEELKHFEESCLCANEMKEQEIDKLMVEFEKILQAVGRK